MGNAAPCSKLTTSGSGTTIGAGAWQYSAYDFTVNAATRAPTFSPVTPSPRASMTPAASMPGVSGSFGFTTYCPCRKRTSAKFTPIACALMSTMPGRTSGFGTSASDITSGPPVCANTIAFISDPLEHVDPLLEHLGAAVTDVDGGVVVPGRPQRADALAQRGRRLRERQRADQIGGAHLLLLRAEEHEMAPVVGQVAGVGRLVRLIDLPVALEQRGQVRRHAAPHVAELLDLNQVVQRDRRVRPGLSPGARAVERLAVLQHRAAGERRGHARGRIDAGRAPRRLHVGDGRRGRAQVAGGEDPA